jgi:hypothetical protein
MDAVPPIYLTREEFYASVPLPNGHIRVLDLEDLGENDDDSTPLRGQIRVVDLAANPRYSTLSYRWDTDHSLPQQDLDLRVFRLSITPGLHECLIHLRRLFGGCTIWIDAVCINQNDLVEKDGQISLMGHIYSKAEICYAWLGPGTPNSDKAMDILIQRSKNSFWAFSSKSAPTVTASTKTALKTTLHDQWRIFRHLLSECKPVPEDIKPPERQIEVWFHDLFTRSWVSRVWVYISPYL